MINNRLKALCLRSTKVTLQRYHSTYFFYILSLISIVVGDANSQKLLVHNSASMVTVNSGTKLSANSHSNPLSHQIQVRLTLICEEGTAPLRFKYFTFERQFCNILSCFQTNSDGFNVSYFFLASMKVSCETPA